MDFMKVFDQTVRDIKREVNLKVLKIPEIEQKVLDATDDEPWGPHGTVLAELAQATKKYTECQMILNVLWTRLEETGKNWRLVYKALTVIEFLVGHGSERAVDDIIEHTFQIASLTSFEFVEPNGKDVGLNVRKKAETIAALLNDKEKIQVVRSKAAANRDKYVGLSSAGISFRSSSNSFGSGGYDSYSDREKDSNRGNNDYYPKKNVDKNEETKNSSHFGRKSETVKVPSAAVTTAEDEFDDFDPRGTSSKAAPQSSGNGQSLLVDLMDAPTSTDADVASSKVEVDLFADAAFVSAQAPPVSSPPTQPLDLFGDQNSPVDLFSSKMSPPQISPVDLFSSNMSPPQNTSNDLFSSKMSPAQTSPVDLFSSKVSPAQNSSVDLFSSKISPAQSSPADLMFPNIPLQSASFTAVPEDSDIFGAFNSATTSEATNAKWSSSNPTKEKFAVKSGIWADSLSRGLIDLNISGPKKVSLVDVGVVGDLNDVQPALSGRAMGSHTAMGTPSPPIHTQPIIDDDFFSSLASSSQYHFGHK